MKFNKFIYATMAAALLAACSDKDIVADGPDAGTVTVPEGGDGFVAVRINLPTQPVAAAPRAANDKYDDGTANEYAVKNGAILLFAGDSESAATFKSAYTLDLEPWIGTPDNVDNITTSSLTSVKITYPADSDGNLYGLVVLNYDGVMKIDADAHTLTIDNVAFTDKTFATFASTVSKKAFYTGSGSSASNFFMINAPVSKVAQTSATAPEAADVTTLVDITGGIKSTKEEAEKNPAGSFFVERAVAKATLSAKGMTVALGTIIDDAGKVCTFSVKDVEWMLNATNNSSYIVRNMYPATGQTQFIGYNNPVNGGYRMVGNTQIGQTIIQPTVNLYRTYWGYDPNYNTFVTGDLTYKANNAEGFVKAANTNPLYCYENTFDVAHQEHRYTTQALLKVKFDVTVDGKPVNSFYTINDRQNVIYPTAAIAEKYPIGQIIKDSRVAAAIATAIEGTGETVEINEKNYTDYLTITFARNANGLWAVSDIDFVEKAFTDLNNGKDENDEGFVKGRKPVFTGTDKADLIAEVNAAYRIAEYTGNVAYYAVRIKHFAGESYTDLNDLAPWNAEFVHVGAGAYDYATYTPISASDKDGDAENMWLGRYGMVRNNWYDINVTSVKKLGKPSIEGLEVPSDKTTDDETEQWIAFKVNILSWAKRAQKVEI